jgi:hypothetical protein
MPAPPVVLHCSKAGEKWRQADNPTWRTQPVQSRRVQLETTKFRRKAMYIGIGGLILLIILLVVLL